jgi:predicted RNase H-like nuclease (RuvC/YqgF family)
MTPDQQQSLDNLIKLGNIILIFLGPIIVGLIGLKQYREGRKKDDITSAAQRLAGSSQQLVGVAQEIVQMKESEADELRKKIDALSDKMSELETRNIELGKRLQSEIGVRVKNELLVETLQKQVEALSKKVAELETENSVLRSAVATMNGAEV